MKEASAETKAIAVCIDTRDGAGRNRLHGAARYLRRLGWRMMLVRQSGKDAAQEVARLEPDGIIAYIADRWLVEAARSLVVPLVDTALGDVAVPLSVSVDNDAIGRMAAEHLSDTGLKHFGYCGVKGRRASEERRASFGKAARDSKLTTFAEPVSEGESQLEALMAWLRSLPKPVGLLVFDDKLGERVLTACRWAELSVPEQVAVLGIGNDELMCDVSWPALSSVSLPTSRLGFEAARMLVRAVSGKNIRQRLVKIQPTGVVTRGSTDVVAVDDPLLKTAIRYIRLHSASLIGPEHVAEAMKCSRRTLDRRFISALGRTARDELARVRMRLARELLGGQTRTLAEVARGCGYANGVSFSRAFRQQVGVWPSEYREQNRVI